MKKLFLFTCLIVLAISFNSCSKDDGPNPVENINDNGVIGTISFTGSGVQRTFTTGTIYEQANTDGSSFYKVTAFENEDATERIYFELKKGFTGDDGIYYLQYTHENLDYYGTFSVYSDIVTNDGNTLKGTFFGTVTWVDDIGVAHDKGVSNGSFEVSLAGVRVI
jgi:hypothetical protein